MALTRAMLKGMGLTEEQVSAIIDAHQETLDGLNRDYKVAKADADRLQSVQKELDDLKAATVAKSDYDKLKASYDDYKADVAGKEALASKQHAFRALLTAEKIPAKYHDRIVKMTDFDGMELDGDKLKDESATRKSIKADWGEFIGTDETHGANVDTPPRNVGGAKLTKEQIMSIRDTAERQKAIADNPEAFGLNFSQ